MSFNIDTFNKGFNYDVKENLGKLIYQGINKQYIIEDGKRTDKERATHIIVFSEKLGESLQLKLRDELNFKELPFMSEVEVIGAASPWIYEFPRQQSRNGETYEFVDYGFSLRIDDYRQAGQSSIHQSQTSTETKTDDKSQKGAK